MEHPTFDFVFFWCRLLWVLLTTFVIAPVCLLVVLVRLGRRWTGRGGRTSLVWPACCLVASVAVAVVCAWSLGTIGFPP